MARDRLARNDSGYESMNQTDRPQQQQTYYPPPPPQQQQQSQQQSRGFSRRGPPQQQQQYPPPQQQQQSQDLTEQEFYTRIYALRSQNDSFDRATQDMRLLQQKLMQSVSVDESSSSQLKALQDSCRRYINDIKLDLKSLVDTFNNGRIQTNKPEPLKAQIQLIKDTFKMKLSAYQSVLNDYQTKQRERIKRQIKIVKPDASEDEIRRAQSSDGAQVFQQAMMSSQRRGEALETANRVEERYQNLERLQKDIVELSLLFQDLNTMVLEQGEQLTFVRDTAVAVQEDTKGGVEHLDQGVKAARRLRNTKKWCLIIFLIILVIAGIIVGVKIGIDKAGNNNNNPPAATTPARAAAPTVAAAVLPQAARRMIKE